MNKQALIQKIKSITDLSSEEKAELISLVNNTKKYGLVWEEKFEQIEEELKTKLPVLREVKERFIQGQPKPREEEGDDLFNQSEDSSSEFDKSDFPNHILIEGDNLHALTALSFTHKGAIDVIYIDPPYNTGNKDFVYNDKFVDKDDEYRHSKWVSFMSRRLKVAKLLIKDSGVLVISIGYHEVSNLVLLCSEIFNDRQVVAVTVQTSGGKPSGGFNFLHEYLVYVTPEDFTSNPLSFAGGNERSPFEGLTLSTFDKTQRPNQFYPIFLDAQTGYFRGVGPSLAERVKSGTYAGELGDFQHDFSEAPKGTVAVWPITSKGKTCVWRLISTRLQDDWQDGYIKVSKNKSKVNPNKFSLQYLPEGVIEKVKNGELSIEGTEPGYPTLIFGQNETVGGDIPSIWLEKDFFTTKGTSLFKDILPKSKFSYPKPIGLISEAIRSCSDEAGIILDFFAGSGTTLHATMQLNAEDGGKRQCILVTNNENNICEEVTYERNKRAIQGYATTKGEQVPGLTENNLRYYQCDYVPSERTEVNRRKLTGAGTELLMIKEDCYEDVTEQHRLNPRHCRLFTNCRGKYLAVLYHSRQPEAVNEAMSAAIAALPDLSGKVRLYGFSPEIEVLLEDFFEVRDRITAVPLPDAIYNAYRATFKTMGLGNRQKPAQEEMASQLEETDQFNQTADQN